MSMAAAEAVIKFLGRRKGFRWWWSEIEEDVQNEIVCGLADVIDEKGDGDHTFEDMYKMRLAMTVALLQTWGELPDHVECWRSKAHHDGSMFDDYFIIGMTMPTIGQVSWHYPLKYWDLFDGPFIDTLDRAPKFDGHTEGDVMSRLIKFSTGKDVTL